MKKYLFWGGVFVLAFLLYRSLEHFTEHIRPGNPGHCVNNPWACGN